MTAIDLSEHEDTSALFAWVYLPLASAITSVDLRWGSSVSSYWNQTATTAHFGAFVDGWNLIRFDWDGATETSTPDASAIDVLRLTINYDGVAETDIRVDNIVSVVGNIYDLLYYSDTLFTNAAGTSFKQSASEEDDLIILEPSTRNGLIWKVAEFAAQQIQYQNSSIDLQYFAQQYLKWKVTYQRTYKSEAMRTTSDYYSRWSR